MVCCSTVLFRQLEIEIPVPVHEAHRVAALPDPGEPQRSLNVVRVPRAPVGQHPVIVHQACNQSQNSQKESGAGHFFTGAVLY